MRHFLILALLAGACSDDAPQNATEIVEGNGQNDTTLPSTTFLPAQEPAPAPSVESAKIGPLLVSYDGTSLTMLPAKVSVPPDWKVEVPGSKLIARNRAALIGKAECLYGQSGQASQCNVQQEAGVSFAFLDRPFSELSGNIPTDQRKPVQLAGAAGTSWQIGAEGEGAEYILLPAPGGSILIVRQFRATENLEDNLTRQVLNGLRIDRAR